MTALRSLGYAGALLSFTALCAVGCGEVRSLGTGDDGGTGGGESNTGGKSTGGSNSGQGGKSTGGMGGSFGYGGKSSGGSDNSGGQFGQGGKATGGFGGVAGGKGSGGSENAGGKGSGGGLNCELVDCAAPSKCAVGQVLVTPVGECCPRCITPPVNCDQVACAPVPPQCPEGQILTQPPDNCCVQCVPKENLPPAGCRINGVDYQSGGVVVRDECTSCVCIDGVIGRCTGACTHRDGGGTDFPPPACADGEELIEGCADCSYEYCNLYEYKCRKLVTGGCSSAKGCGTDQVCFRNTCLSASEVCHR